MFKASWHEKQILIVLLWAVLIFIGYNVITVEATESNDKKVCEEYNGKWKDIGGGDRGCVIDNEQDQQRYGMRPGYSLDSTSGDAEYGIEDLVTYDNEGNKVYPETDSSEDNPNNVDDDNDGIYDDEELTDEEERELADAPTEITGDDVEEEEEESDDDESEDDEQEEDEPEEDNSDSES